MPQYRVAFTPDAAGAVGQLSELATALAEAGAEDKQIVNQVRVHDPGLAVEGQDGTVDGINTVSETTVAIVPIARVLHVTRVENEE